jgi:predicted kinase
MWQLTKSKDWTYLLQKFDWVKDMESIPQDALHHAEGNVAIHTQMVIEELLNLPEYQSLDEQSKEILWASALMHDIEKRSTTVLEGNGRITSKNHAKRGEFTAREILYCDIPTPFEIREQIAKLVRYHGLPLWILEKENPQKALLQASLEVNTEWLTMLAKADALGRICQDQADLLYRIELFKELCIENDCWGKPKAFASDLARFEYFSKEDKTPDYQPFEDFKTEVVMLVGLPGSGKDTYIQKHLKDLAVVSLDDFRKELKISPTDAKGNGKVVQLAKESAKTYLRKQIPFVWNATNITRQLREQLIELFVTYKAKVKIVYIEVPFATQQKQNRSREAVVPQAVIERMLSKLEIPQVWEVVEVEYQT